MASLKLAFALAFICFAVCELGVQGMHYHYYKTPTTWFNAKTNCEKLGYKLASPKSAAENAAINAELVKRRFSYTWLSYNDNKCDGKFGMGSSKYTKWNRGEPNGRRGENCAEFYTSRGGVWNDVSCGNRRSYVCKKGSDNSYAYFKGGKNYNDAANDCKRHGYQLACVSSPAENSKIHAELSRRRFGNTWIGHDDNSCEGDFSCSAGYSNWNKGEPNGGRRENCVMVYPGKGLWNDLSCNRKIAYVCEQDVKVVQEVVKEWEWVSGDEKEKKSEDEPEKVLDEPEVEEEEDEEEDEEEEE